MNILAVNLKAFAGVSGLSGQALSSAMGLTQPTYSRIAAGRTKSPDFASLAAIASYYGFPVEDLLSKDLTDVETLAKLRERLKAKLPPKTQFDEKLLHTWAYKVLEGDVDQLRAMVLIMLDVITENSRGAAKSLASMMDQVPPDYGDKGFHARVSKVLGELQKRDEAAGKDAPRRGARG